MAECVFCRIASGGEPEREVWDYGAVIAFEPLMPVTLGHLLVVPRRHVFDALADFKVTLETMRVAVTIGRDKWPCNIITSAGAAASQSVFHLHIHVVPRRPGDGLVLPWTHQQEELAKLPGAGEPR